MPSVYGEREIPGNVKIVDKTIEYAVGVAKELKSIVWLARLLQLKKAKAPYVQQARGFFALAWQHFCYATV